MFDRDLLVPFGYSNRYVTLGWLEEWLLVHHHPEYVRRLLAWLHFKGGAVGVGGGWRAGGAQPDRPGFAPEGKSFHQDQAYDDGFVGACAVDTVFRDGPDAGDAHDGIAWSEVPQQGSAEAAIWGVHANVGSPSLPGGESWHIQPVEIDGWATWWNSGRPAPRAGYPIPPEHDPYAQPKPEPPAEVPDMPDTALLWRHADYAEVFLLGAGQIVNVSPDVRNAYNGAGVPLIVDRHPGLLADVLHHTGRTITDLTRIKTP